MPATEGAPWCTLPTLARAFVPSAIVACCPRKRLLRISVEERVQASSAWTGHDRDLSPTPEDQDLACLRDLPVEGVVLECHVLAHAASLDLLSGGRFELGLGAGGFWDAIEAMGGPRRAPGEAVEALSEAIDIIRGIRDAGNRSPLRVDGLRYRVDGAKRGPAPAHDIGVRIGAYKRRMLRLIGR